QGDACVEAVLAGLSGGGFLALLLDEDEPRVLPREPHVDVTVRELGRDLQRDLRQGGDQAEGRGLLSRSLQPLRRLDELVASELRQLAQVCLEGFDELCRLHDCTMTS